MRGTLNSAPITAPDRFYIGGEWVLPSGGSTFDVIDSTTEEVFLTVAEALDPDVERAVAAARQAFDDGPWPRLKPRERAVYLRAIAAELGKRASEHAHIWAVESGILHRDAQAYSGALSGVYDYYASLADTFDFVEERSPTGGGEVGLLVREPAGVVAAIVPWNGASFLIAYKCAPALLAGCTIVLKASPEAPAAAYLLAEACEKVGLPAGVVNVITADRAASEMLVRNPGVDKVTFTGSTLAGRRIASICGDRIARCTLELGGKSAAVILDDYDLETAARTIAGSATFNTGQVCSSLTRIIVSRERQDTFLDALGAAFGAITVGDPFEAASQMGPLAMSRQRDRVETYIARGVADGATLVAGGGRPRGLDRGYFVEPTVFGNVDNRAAIAQDEIFGPVLSVIPAANEEAAIHLANDTIYGLNSSVFTDDPDRAYAAARRLRAGTVGHNAYRSDFGIAFGGFKQSGLGREGGIEGLLPFLETKTIILDALPAEI